MATQKDLERNEEIRLRIRQLINDSGLNDARFADKIGMDRSGFSKRMNTKTLIGEAVINKIVLNINVEKQWLLTGIGNVYKKESENINTMMDYNFIRVPMIQPQIEKEYLKSFSNDEFIKKLYSIPEKIDNSFKGKFRIFQITGDAMVDGTDKSILSNDLVLGREVRLESIETNCDSMIRRIFMVVYKDGIIPRRFCSYNKETKEIRFEPLNFLYTDIHIKLDDILELYNVVKILDREYV